MFAVTLISQRGRLGPDDVESLRRAWDGDRTEWLAPQEAAEFAVAGVPADFESVWEEMQSGGADLAIQPEPGRRKRLLIADMDGTMIRQECIDELAEEAGVGDQVREITERAMNGALDFESALIERVRLLEGLPEAAVERVLEERIDYAPGGAALVATMKAHGARCALVSGGFEAFAGAVARRLGFDESRANRLLARDGRLTGEVGRPILGRDAKVEALEELAARLGISPDGAIAVGDGANDLGMLARAGTGVALRAKPAVARQCRIRVNHGDLTALLFLQGYARSAFAA